LFPLWHNQEQLTARYAYRTQLLAFMKKGWANYSNCTDEYERSALVAELDEYLANLRIVPLRKKIQEPAGKETVDSFSLPRTLSNAVMLNAAKASFADVLSIGVLYRSVHCDAVKGRVSVNLQDELRKCGLLRSQTLEDLPRVVLLALSLIWDGQLDDGVRLNLRNQGWNSVVHYLEAKDSRVEQLTDAYPDNRVKSPLVEDSLGYVSVFKQTDGTWFMYDNGRSITVPTQLPNLSYVLSTNGGEIVFEGFHGKPLVITSSHIHVDGRGLTENGRQGLTEDQWNEEKKGTINETELSPEDQETWALYKALVMESVTLKFLFSA
jgi:hypothetical protein